MANYVVDFFSSNIHWTMLVTTAHFLFWIYAFPTLLEYGYTNNIDPTTGSIPSGALGSGVVVMSSFFMCAYTVLFAIKFFTHEVGKQNIGLEEDDD